MKAQFKYTFLTNLHLRWGVIIGAALMNLVFFIMGYNNFYGEGWKITAVVFSSLAMGAIAVVMVIAHIDNSIKLVGVPSGYANALAPVAGWKVILSRVITMLVYDLVSVALGVVGIVTQSLILTNELNPAALDEIGSSVSLYSAEIFEAVSLGLVMLVLLYMYAMFAVTLCALMAKSIFANKRAGALLAVIVTIAALYVLSLLSFTLTPFGTVYNWRFFYTINMSFAWGGGMAVYLMLQLAKNAALFFAASRLYERRLNI